MQRKAQEASESKVLFTPVEVKPIELQTVETKSQIVMPPSEPRRKVAIVGEILFSGSALAQAFLKQDISFCALCPNEAAIQAIEQYIEHPSDSKATIEIVHGDLDSPRAVASVMDGVYGVAFLSPITLTGRMERAKTHLADVRRVIAAAQDASVRKLVYHSALGAHPKSASSALRDAAEAERLIQACQCEDFCARTGLLMGIHDNFLTELLNKARSSSLFMGILGYGGTVLQPMHLRDMARCFASFFLPREEVLQPGIYCLAGPETTTVLELLDMMSKRVGRAKLKLHAPLFILKLLSLVCRGGAFEERVNLLFSVFSTERNDAAKLLGDEWPLLTARQTQEEILAALVHL